MPGVCIHGININNLRYADDTALIANDPKNLQDIVDKVKEESSKAGLDMNVKKTKTMVISRHKEEDNPVVLSCPVRSVWVIVDRFTHVPLPNALEAVSS